MKVYLSRLKSDISELKLFTLLYSIQSHVQLLVVLSDNFIGFILLLSSSLQPVFVLNQLIGKLSLVWMVHVATLCRLRF